jgi:tetratricopeptide (TPR) repeat protein
MNFRKTTTYGYMFLFLFLTFLSSHKDLLAANTDLNADYDKANVLLKQKQYGEALGLFEDILTRAPSFIRGYSDLVKCYRAMGDVQGATIFIESIYLENPEDAVVNYAMGYSLYHQKKYDTSAIFFDKAIQLDPNLAEAWNNRAAIYQFIDKNYDNARQYYNKAISLSKQANNHRVLDIARKNISSLPPPKEILVPVTDTLTLETFINRFVATVDSNNEKQMKELVLGQRENSEKTMQWLIEKAMRAHTQKATEEEQAAVLLGKLLAGLYQESYKDDLLKLKLQEYQNLPDENKNLLVNGELLLQEGLNHEKNKQYQMAEDKYQAALACFEKINDDSRSGMAHNYLGDTHYKMKDYTSARLAYQKSLTFLDGNHDLKRKAIVLSSLGIVCAKLKDYTDALEYLNQSLNLYRKIDDDTSAKKIEKNIELINSMRG